LGDLLAHLCRRARSCGRPSPRPCQRSLGRSGELRLWKPFAWQRPANCAMRFPPWSRSCPTMKRPVRDAALGALVELRDPRAVPALTKTKSMRDRREMRKIVDALAALGGQEAADYLSFVADAHEDEEIRNMASAALVRLRGRSSAKLPTP